MSFQARASVLSVAALLVSSIGATITTTALETYATLVTGPQIWVAKGILDCGAPFVTDPCTTALAYYTETTSWSTSTYGYMMWGLIPLENDYLYTISVPVSLPTRATKLDPYSPTITPTVFSMDASATRSTTTSPAIKRREHISPTPTLAAFHIVSNLNTEKQLQKRTYDYDACSGEPPSHDMVTNSQDDVCQFVAAAQPYFVSLAPTAAALLPSWLSYCMSAVITAVQCGFIVGRIANPSPRKSIWGNLISIFGVLFVLIRTTVAITRIVSHYNTLETLPFISPLLWIDWLALSQTVHYFSPTLGTAVFLPTIAVYGMCLWLCIGYGLFGFGTFQYYVLDVPSECVGLGISWSTDPRRGHFLRLHIFSFSLATISFLSGGLYAMNTRDDVLPTASYDPVPRHRKNPHSVGVTEEGQTEDLGRLGQAAALAKQVVQRVFDNLLLVLSCMIVLLSVVGTIMSAIINRNSYLLLGQHHCYASYVSSRFGYVDLYESEFMDTTIKVMTWLGIHM